ncbi:alpha/beta fold hydrolase [Rhodococcoides yunnanense]|uniref:alpha/beta fold hydrolase n=1 Tax=Rhodococcoides yunnanense TaxID=278209 RepID=UPI0009335BCB|nr:alpha/beta hydrolase [Rhodococcus yunnanensis]
MSYLLVHGAGMGASCWDRLIPALDAQTVAVDLPGRGRRQDLDLRTVTLDDCAAAIIADVRAAQMTDIVVVAHSFAGVSVPRVLEELSEVIRHVVFLSAVVPPDGTRVLDQIDESVRGAVEESISSGLYSQERGAAQSILCNDMDDDQTNWTLDRIVDDAASLLVEKVDLSGLSVPVDRTYIRLTRDVCYPDELQQRSAALVGGRTRELDTGHMAMVSNPSGLAQILTELHS